MTASGNCNRANAAREMSRPVLFGDWPGFSIPPPVQSDGTENANGPLTGKFIADGKGGVVRKEVNRLGLGVRDEEVPAAIAIQYPVCK